jgi:(4-O-methyl)-D-glucuronate---lignin esterase
MRTLVCLMLGALALSLVPSPAPAMQRPAADQPIERIDENSRIAHAQLLEKASQGRVDLYFEGDSITRRWGATDYPEFLEHWRQSFFGWNAGNFAWGGDTTGNILWRLENGELDGVDPKVIVLLAGTNNVGSRMPPGGEGGDDAKAADIASGIRAILDRMQEKAPGATIILMGIFPRNDNIAVMSTIRKINAIISGFADGNRIRYLDISDRLADTDGRLFEGMSPEGLHLTRQGYVEWAEALEPLLLDLLGPRAEQDLAPPPTGDPSARRQ